ncbi:MAG: cation diffusion facilitator family transporter [Vulcanimicrobiaceae bacterium]
MSHPHGAHARETQALRVAFFATLAILLVEAFGGWYAGSLALLADAAHMATDAAAAGLALWAAAVASRAPDDVMTYGYGRAKVLAALANAVALILVVTILVWVAVLRLADPTPVRLSAMIAVPAAALIANLLLSLYLARRGGGSLNVRVVIAHVAGDAAISFGVIVAGILIAVTGRAIIDPIVSLAASAIVAYSAWGLVRESLGVLMEAAPREVRLPEVRAALLALDDVGGVHDLHCWTLADGHIAASLHVAVPEQTLAYAPDLVVRVKQILNAKFAIAHATVEVECDDCASVCH